MKNFLQISCSNYTSSVRFDIKGAVGGWSRDWSSFIYETFPFHIKDEYEIAQNTSYESNFKLLFVNKVCD